MCVGTLHFYANRSGQAIGCGQSKQSSFNWESPQALFETVFHSYCSCYWQICHCSMLKWIKSKWAQMGAEKTQQQDNKNVSQYVVYCVSLTHCAQHWYKMSKAVKLKVKRYYDHQLIKLEVTKMVTWPTLEFSLCSAQQEIKICPTYRPQLQVTVYSHRWDTYAVTLFINTAFE